jgi:hypothetical protein
VDTRRVQIVYGCGMWQTFSAVPRMGIPVAVQLNGSLKLMASRVEIVGIKARPSDMERKSGVSGRDLIVYLIIAT